MQERKRWVYAIKFEYGVCLTLSIETEFFILVLGAFQETCFVQPRIHHLITHLSGKVIPQESHHRPTSSPFLPAKQRSLPLGNHPGDRIEIQVHLY